MLFDTIALIQGASVINLACASGTVYPALPIVGELFFRSDLSQLSVYNGTAWASISGTASSTGTVTSVSVSTANGISGAVSTATSTPAITLTLGAVTPTSVAATGAVSGSNLSGTNTGDQTITLIGDVTGVGTGSFATTLTSVNGNTGSFGSSSVIPVITVDAKGRITAVSTATIAAQTAAAGTLTGTTLASNVLASSLTSVGILTGLTVNNTIKGIDGVGTTLNIVGGFPTAPGSGGGNVSVSGTVGFTDNVNNGSGGNVTIAAGSAGGTTSGTGGAGVISITAGTGFNSTSSGSSLGGSGGTLSIQAGAGGSGGATSGPGGAGGNLFIKGSVGGAGQNGGANGAGGNIQFQTSAANLAPATVFTISNTGAASFVNTVSAGSFIGSLSGNASTASTASTANTLTTARAINGVNFDGSAAITITAASGTLTGTTLAPTVVSSSLTTVGTLGTLAVSGNVTSSDPTTASQLATKNYVDNAIAGLTWKTAVSAATTANITLSGAQTIDGVAVTVGQRVLVKNQTTASANGIYIVAAGAWSRATDFVTPAQINGAAVYVDQGTANGNSTFTVTAIVNTISTDPINFSQLSAAVSVAASSLTGSTLASNVVTSSLTSVGTLGSLAVTGNITAGNFSGTSTGTNTGNQTITLTGDVAGSGTGSFAATLATVNASTGSFGSSSVVPVITVDAKGRITSVSTATIAAQTAAAAGTLTGTALAPNVVTSSLTSLGTIASLSFTGTLTVGGSTGTANQVLTSNGAGAPTWVTPASTAFTGGAVSGATNFASQVIFSSATSPQILIGNDTVQGFVSGWVRSTGTSIGLAIFGSSGVTSGAGGLLTLAGGTGAAGQLGGDATFKGGSGSSTTGNAATIVVGAFNSSTGAAGDATISGGPAPSGISGGVSFTVPNAGTQTQVEKFRLNNTGALTFGGAGAVASGYGTSGQVLTSAGNTAPTWTTPTATAAAAGTLTGTTIAANVIASSLTSVGTLTGLTINGNVSLISSTTVSATSVSAGAGSALSIASGTTTAAANGGALSLISGDGGSTGGAVTITSGRGQTSSGDITIKTGSFNGSSAIGTITIQGGSKSSGVAGGGVQILGSPVGAGGGTPADVMIRGGDASGGGSTAVGGNAIFQGGNSSNTFSITAGNAIIRGGQQTASTSFPGGDIILFTHNTGSSTFVERLRILGTGQWNLGGVAATAGQVLTTVTAGVAPTWAAAPPDATKLPLTGGTLTGALTVLTGGVGTALTIGAITDTTNTIGVNVKGAGTVSLQANANSFGAVEVYVNNGGANDGYGMPTGTSGIASFNSVPFVIGVNQAERMRINGSGDIMLGIAATNGITPDHGVTIIGANGSTQMAVGHVAGTVAGTTFINFAYAAGTIGNITQNGTTGVLFNQASDVRLKKDIVDAPAATDIVKAVKVRSYNWKSANEPVLHGFIAQELVQQVPSAVNVGDADPTVITQQWGVDYSKLVPVLTKALQEALARIDALEARLTAKGL